MKAILLSIHVLAVIMLIGPITVAASLFPRYARSAATSEAPGSAPSLAVAAALHRISHGYTVPAIAVPVFGIGLAAVMGALGQVWIILSMLLTAIGAAMLVARINPTQRWVLAALRTSQSGDDALLGRLRNLGMITGMFALSWAVVVVLMIVRPGSTTGVRG